MFPLRTARFCWALLLLCLAAASLGAQPGDGFVVQERPGLVFVKPQPWSKDSEATMFEFQAFINRTAGGGSGAGYYEFRTKTADRRQIPTARIVRLVVYPDVEQFKDVIGPEDRRALVSTIEDLRNVAAKYPSSRTYLEPSIGKLSEEVARYDSGNIKSDGVWESKETYAKRLATKLAGLLKAEIARAQPPSSMNLEDDPKFTGLKQLAETNPDAKRLVREISMQFERLVRAEKRGDLVAKLGRSGVSLAEAQATLEQLKALQPDEDPKVAALVKTWDSGLAAVEAISPEAEEICALLEGELEGITEANSVPKISPEIERRISALDGRVTRFLAAKPPIQLTGAIQKAMAVCAAKAGFAKLKGIVVDKQYIDAKDVLDDMARQASLIGPQTARIVTGLHRQAIEKIELFTRLRAEGKLLAESGKKREALEKFQEAFAVIPDAEIGHHISQLKQEVSAVSSNDK